jgi:hypothetical protein
VCGWVQRWRSITPNHDVYFCLALGKAVKIDEGLDGIFEGFIAIEAINIRIPIYLPSDVLLCVQEKALSVQALPQTWSRCYTASTEQRCLLRLEHGTSGQSELGASLLSQPCGGRFFRPSDTQVGQFPLPWDSVVLTDLDSLGTFHRTNHAISEHWAAYGGGTVLRMAEDLSFLRFI